MKKANLTHPGWIAGGIAVLVALWLLSGAFGDGPAIAAVAIEGSDEPALTPVQVRLSQAQDLTRESTVSARTTPARSVELRAEIGGRVAQLAVERGARVLAGQEILRLDPGDTPAQLAKVQALVRQRELQFEAAQRLRQNGHQSPVDLATAKANLALAQADLAQIEQVLRKGVLLAPFAGVLERRPVEVGQYVSVGDELGLLIQQDPLIVRGEVTEDVVIYLQAGGTAHARLADGSVREGQLRYVASQADAATRTFAVELAVANADQRLIAGASAHLVLPLEAVSVHRLEPALLALDAAGEFGVKSVDAQGRVVFHPAQIAQSRDDQVWLSGLPPRLQIITRGQGFVSVGQQVQIDTQTAQR